MLAWHSHGFPLKKAQEYVSLRKPALINNVFKQDLLLDRRSVYRVLSTNNVPIPNHIVVSRTPEQVQQGLDPEGFVETADYVAIVRTPMHLLLDMLCCMMSPNCQLWTLDSRLIATCIHTENNHNSGITPHPDPHWHGNAHKHTLPDLLNKDHSALFAVRMLFYLIHSDAVPPCRPQSAVVRSAGRGYCDRRHGSDTPALSDAG